MSIDIRVNCGEREEEREKRVCNVELTKTKVLSWSHARGIIGRKQLCVRERESLYLAQWGLDVTEGFVASSKTFYGKTKINWRVIASGPPTLVYTL